MLSSKVRSTIDDSIDGRIKDGDPAAEVMSEGVLSRVIL